MSHRIISSKKKLPLQKNWEATPTEITSNSLADFNMAAIVFFMIFALRPVIKKNYVFHHSSRHYREVFICCLYCDKLPIVHKHRNRGSAKALFVDRTVTLKCFIYTWFILKVFHANSKVHL